MSILDEGFGSPSAPSRNRPHGNLNVLRLAVLLLFAVLVGQLAWMQLWNGDDYARRAEENHITQETTLPPRGLIYDRNGEALVENVGVYTATVTPEFLPEEEDARYTIYLQLEKMLGVPALEVQQKVKAAEDANQAYLAIPVAKYLTREQAISLDEASVDLPGVSLSVKPGRDYTGGTEFSDILGYVGDQTAEEHDQLAGQGYALNEPVGKSGVESHYEQDLRGTPGVTAAEQDAEGHLIESLKSEAPVPGNSVRLAIDAGLQRYISELLEDARGDSQTAAAVVMSPKDGSIYAIVSIPTFDNNIFDNPDGDQEYQSLLNDPRRPLLNQALVPVAPGSTFKLVTASAALQNGNISQYTPYNIPSAVKEVKDENGQDFPLVDWRAQGYVSGIRDALAWSSNIYMFMASCGILGEVKGMGQNFEDGASILSYYARGFGLGSPAGIDIDGEFPGLVPDAQWKRRAYSGPEYTETDRDWYYSDLCYEAIGQGAMTASPLQMARVTAAVANGGTLVTPHVVDSIVSPSGSTVRKVTPDTKTVPVSAANLQVVREGMHQCVYGEAGACHNAGLSGIDIAGKTGTAEFIRPDGTKDQHAWFTGFAPYDNPDVVVTVYFETGWGGDKAAPIAGLIAKYFEENVKK